MIKTLLNSILSMTSSWVITPIMLLVALLCCPLADGLAQTTRYEAENMNKGGDATVATVHSGYTGSGYITGMQGEWSQISFDRGDGPSPSQLVIRYANGTGAAVTNLAFYIGSDKIQDLVFPSTGSWTTWSTLTVNFNLPGGYLGLRIKSTAIVSTSVNIDYIDYAAVAPAVATPTFSPVAGTYTAAQSVTISTSTSGSTIYYTQDGSTPTTGSTVYSGAINVNSSRIINAIAVKSGMTNSNVASAAYTINLPAAPGAFTQTAPTSGATGVSTSPSFTWAASSNAASYTLVVSPNSNLSSPVINQSGITGTSFNGSGLNNSTQYYWRVTAVNATGSTNATNSGIAFTTTAPLPTVATPTFSPAAGTYTSAQSVTISSTTSGATIYYTTDGSTPTTSSTVYTGALNVGSTQTIKAIGAKSGSNNSAVASATYTINLPVPAPGAFTQTTPASGATSVSTSPSFSWAASSNAASYTLLVSPNSNLSSPVINQSGITGTSYTGSGLSNSTQYYWRVTAVNATGSTVATNSGISFTTGAQQSGPTGNITREFWEGITGTSVNALLNSANYPNNPTSTSLLTSFQTPSNVGTNYGQRVKGYLVPNVTGAYQFYIASDDDAELWLSTTEFASNKVKIASVTGWTNELQYDKYSTQASATINLTAGAYYYIEALHKEADGGDHLSVGWKTPGNSNIVTLPGSVLSTQPGAPLPAPTAFNQTAPASGATGVSRVPTFTWAASANTASYTLVVSTNSNLSSPVINQAGLTNTSYTPGTALATSTTYYWRVTAVGEGGTRIATNAGISFTTEAIPAPGSFSQTTPASSATGVNINPSFSWTSSLEATTYTLVVSTNSNLSSPVINQSGINGTNYSPASALALNTTYYWRVTAVNSSGSTVATNGGISFTTSAVANTIYISTTGIDAANRDGSEGSPWRTLAYAATRATAGKTIFINAGEYVETQPVILPIGVSIIGAGELTTTVKAGNLGNGAGKEDFTGSLIQLISPSYVVDQFSAPIAPANGNQTIAGFTIDGMGKTLKAGIWLQARNNVTIRNVTIKDCALRGAVACFGQKKSKEEPPYYITGLKMYDMSFINSGADLSDESTGNLCIAHTDGADIYNININDTYGYGIKFIFEGYYKNTKIRNCNIAVNESDPLWTEDIAIELWNLGPGNEVDGVNCNTWLSFVNWANTFNNPTAAGAHLKVNNCRIIDNDGTSLKEGIELACSGGEVSNCYFQNKGWGVAVWLQAQRKTTIRNNIFYNSQPQAVWADAGAVFIVADEVPKMEDIKIYNNVYDNLKTSGGSPLKIVSVWKGIVEGLDVANNVTTNSLAATYDLYLYNGTNVTNVTYRNNLRDIAHNTFGTIAQSGNLVNTTPGFKLSGLRYDTYYQPAASGSFVVDKGVNVGFPYSGSAPDLGRWEFAGAPTPPASFAQTTPASSATNVSTTPTFTWAASTGASTYALVVSTNSSFTSPIINQTGLTGTSHTASTSLANSTVYYWKVTATNATGSTIASNAGISFTTQAPPPPAVATPTFSVAAGTYTSAQSVVISTTTSGASIRYTTDGSTPTDASTLYASAVNISSTQTLKAIATKAGMSNSAVASATYTINLPQPAPGAFTQTAPAVGATGIAVNPSFTWATSSNAASYTLLVSVNSNLSSPVINQTGITGTSFSASGLNNSTQYYWSVTAVNATGSTMATNAGISFTTTAAPVGQPGVVREYWEGIPGTAVSALTSNANYPNNPTSTSILSNFNAPLDAGENYGQRIKGYLSPTSTGSYTFSIAADDDAELWLSTNDNPANKVKIASVTGWTNYLQYDKFSSQTSAAISLTAGNYYYIEAIQKEASGGDHLTVAWQGPGVSHQIISSTYLSTAPPVPVTPPGAFTLSAPANAATAVSLTPAFSWTASAGAATYRIEVSTNSSYTSPAINQTGITGTSFTPGGGLAGNTTYYWRVTAINGGGSTVASNAGRTFTTLTPPAPSAFTQTAPAASATSVSRTPTFTWAAAANASTYALTVSVNSNLSSPLINASNLTNTSFSPGTSLAANTTYYWRVVATNSTGSTTATNSGISFTTSATTGTYYYVSTTGVDAVGRGSSSSPFRTVAYAASQVPANQNNTIYINAGTYNETQPIKLPLGVNIEGAGVDQVTLTSSGVALDPGVSESDQDYKLWADGSLIQASSPIYTGSNPRYGSPSQMIAAVDGNHTISGFTIDGNNKSLKAGVWVVNRNNITMHHVNFKDLKQTGAVFTRGDMWYYEPLPEGKWMMNVKVHDCTFTNSGSNPGEQEGCLKIGGIDGCEIYNINITDPNGEGIKFAHVGHHRNTVIHDCYMRLSESHPQWGEFMSIELWNLSYGNEVYNIDCNTWFSFVNFNQITSYEPVGTEANNLKIHDCRIIDLDGSSSKEAIEAAHSGIQIYNNYIQDKGFAIAIWNGMGQAPKKNFIIRNNIIANVLRTPGFGFGNSSAVFVPDAAQNIKIYNNVFDRMGNGLQLTGASGTEVMNNVFLNTEGADVEGGSGTVFNNNLKFHTNSQKANFVGASGSNNVLGNPGFQNTGARWDTYYKPASSTSFAVNKGVNVGLPFIGSAPDIGRWEYGAAGRMASENRTEEEYNPTEAMVRTYPNPSTGIVTVEFNPILEVREIQVINLQGKVMINNTKLQRGSIDIDLTDYQDDLYLLKVVHANGVITKKIMLLH